MFVVFTPPVLGSELSGATTSPPAGRSSSTSIGGSPGGGGVPGGLLGILELIILTALVVTIAVFVAPIVTLA